jgi:small-conductance mechanosensitive channel
VSSHPVAHFFWTIGFLVVTAAACAAVRHRALRRRLLFAMALLLLSLGVHTAVLELPQVDRLQQHAVAIEVLLVSVALIAAAVALIFNPWTRDRVGEGTPAIVQDATIVVLGTIAALIAFPSSGVVLGVTGSAIVAGLALQDTLGNAFAGLAIQIEKPFRVGQWIATGDHEGRVVEVTWRATKLRTKPGNLVVLPNNLVAGAAITNYSEPAAPTRVVVEVGASYGAPPNRTREALLAAAARVKSVLPNPASDVVFKEFGASALIFQLRVWVTDYEWEEEIRGDVRSAIYYEFGRRGIEIPYPIQVEYGREESRPDLVALRGRYEAALGNVPVLRGLPPDARQALASTATERLYADGEVIVREGDPAGSMFIVLDGRVAVTVGSDDRQVAITETGGYFGEMSLLTGQPRTATVTARGDALTLEIAADHLRAYAQEHPEVIDQLAAGAALRQRELETVRAAADAGSSHELISLVQRIRRFFRLG